jgi:putative membrane protein
MFHDFSMHGWGMGWGWLISLIIIGVLIWLLVKAFAGTGQSKTAGDKKPLDILKERYAKGEITREEFEERKKDLS